MDGRSFGDHRIDDDLKGGRRPGDEQCLVEVDDDGVGRAHIELGGGGQSRETGCTYREGKMTLDARVQGVLLQGRAGGAGIKHESALFPVTNYKNTGEQAAISIGKVF